MYGRRPKTMGVNYSYIEYMGCSYKCMIVFDIWLLLRILFKVTVVEFSFSYIIYIYMCVCVCVCVCV